MVFKRYLKDLASLFFPQACAACDVPLAYGEQIICATCWFHLPYTNAHHDPHNESARQLWGRVQLEAVASFLYFRDSSRVQNIMHQFKYGGRSEIGEFMGLAFGERLRTASTFDQVDFLVPVPLHPSKLRKRGYNQSAFFAKGLSLAMQKPVLENAVVRQRATQSQTQKTRYERYKNMLETFAVPNPDVVAGRHILVVDDVLTTGATIEACADVLLANSTAKVSAVTLAKAL